ncbi:DUF6265 family protein [Sphingobium sp. H39-3-25]|uniref:DUF6265 family protein n=1 Tax=Sphingobium arseniciresistens TaxID=3030834 RepID=UPI0023B98A9D|nr:DUF6265 family protein [Sphingobium arseniciresistens]
MQGRIAALAPLMMVLSTTLLSAAPSAAIAQQAASGHLPPWLAGAWQEIKGDRWTEEYWTPPRGGIMIGAGRSGRGEALSSWEATRIQIGKDGSIAFHASPEGGASVAFPMVSQGANEVTFANPGHDYPQRIRYWREGATLHAETALMDGSKAMRWSYKAMGR